jgi:hypothetical protein
MTTNHRPQAGLCQICLDKLTASIERSPQQRLNLVWCPHRETFAKVSIENGIVIGWELKSPVAEGEARKFFEQQAQLANQTDALPWKRSN